MYDFHTLSPVDFEELVRDLLQAEFGVRFESFGPAADKGIDFRTSKGEGGIVVQAKHYLRSGPKELLRAAGSENLKIAILEPRPARYVLATSVSLTPAIKDKILAAMPDTPLLSEDIYGQEDLNNLISRHQEIETKHFKLWLSSTPILERILRSGIYNRTQTELTLIREMVPRFVQNQSVREAETILANAGTLIIAGEPGVGKTTLARMLIWLHASQNWRIFVVDDISEAFDVANEGDSRLIFFDDFLGQVQISADLVRGMDQRLPPFLERVRTNRNLRFILTTRDYILSQAQLLSSRLSSHTVHASRYILNVGAYPRGARARILYNHIYFSDLSDKERDALLADDFYLNIIDHKNFNPRLIQTFTSASYADFASEPIRTAVYRTLNNPQELWERPYRNHISDEGKALMLSILFNRRIVPLPELQQTFVRVAAALELPIARAELWLKFRAALKELEGSVVAIIDRQVRFANPGVRDYLEAVVFEDAVLPLVIKHIETYDELRQCWSIWNAKDPKLKPTAGMQHLWTAAIDRMQAADSGIAIDRLALAIELYDHFQNEALLERVRRALAAFEDAGLDGEQVGAACSALENATMNLLPIEELDQVHRILTTKVAEMLEVFAFALDLEDIEALDDALHKYGADEDIASNAINVALGSFVKGLDQHLDDINSVDDLDSFERKLGGLMNLRGFYASSVQRDITYRRERLYERDEQDEERGRYSGQRSIPAELVISTDEIRSMFQDIAWR